VPEIERGADIEAGVGPSERRAHAATAAVGAPVLPVVFVFDEDRASLAAVMADLSRRFGNDFAVRGECSPELTLASLRDLAERELPVALLLFDGRHGSLLARAHELHPTAKRVLLVDRDYTSTSPAVRAMTLGEADFHIVRPWADDEVMYRAMSEYLSSLTSEHEPSFELFRIVASAGDSRVPEIRDVMTRLHLPFGFYPLEGEQGPRLLEEAGLDREAVPVVIGHDGRTMVDPSMAQLAAAFGVSIKNEVESCDLAILGAGPAGLTAAVYAASEGLETVVLEQEVSGGQAGTSPLIRNYPGFPHGVEGGLLMERTCEQAWLMGAKIVFAQQVVALEQDSGRHVVRLADGSRLSARTVLVATGMRWRRLGVARLEGLIGSGVYYGAAAGETRAMQDREVFVVGAGNSAGQACLHLAGHARRVTLLARGESLGRSMSQYLIDGLLAAPNVEVRLRTEVVDGAGGEVLEGLTLCDRASGQAHTVSAGGLFIMIGGEPHAQWLPPAVARDAKGYILTGTELLEQAGADWELDREPLTLETSLPGVFAAGDVRRGAMGRVASAVGEGATAVRLVHEHLQRPQAATPRAPAPSRRAAPRRRGRRAGRRRPRRKDAPAR